LIEDGATEKIPQLRMPLKSIYSESFGFNEKKVLEHCTKVATINNHNYYNTSINILPTFSKLQAITQIRAVSIL
jgi:hypothetical protein